MTEAAELDTKQEEASHNGHGATFQTFDDDSALLKHIMSKKPAEKLVEVPEWEVEVLCKALGAEARVDVQIKSSDEETRRYDYRKQFGLIAMYGCYNPITGKRIFRESHLAALSREQDGEAIERLAITILRLSRMLSDDTEQVKKN